MTTTDIPTSTAIDAADWCLAQYREECNLVRIYDKWPGTPDLEQIANVARHKARAAAFKDAERYFRSVSRA